MNREARRSPDSLLRLQRVDPPTRRPKVSPNADERETARRDQPSDPARRASEAGAAAAALALDPGA